MQNQNKKMPKFLIVILCIVLFNVVEIVGSMFPVLYVPLFIISIIVIIIVDKIKKSKNNTQETTQDIFEQNINQDIFNQSNQVTEKFDTIDNITICNDNCEHVQTTPLNKECKHCGAKNPNNAKHCDCCGNKL